MRDIKSKYGKSKRHIVIALNGLADDAMRSSDSIPWGEAGFLDVLVQLMLKVTAGAPAGDKNCIVYAYGTAQGGGPYSGGATGVNEAFGSTPGQLITNCFPLGIVTLDNANEPFPSDVFSVAAAFGGVLPEEGGIIVLNQSGQALADTDNIAFYQGVLAQG